MSDHLAVSPFAHHLRETPPVDNETGVQVRDLSLVPRIGFKGSGTTGWLTAKVDAMPTRPNSAVTLANRASIAWLGGQEYLILSDPDGKTTTCGDLEAAWLTDRAAGKESIGYSLPRSDSHGWLWLTGADVPAMMAKICGVDLRPDVFQEGAIAQTVVARLGAILIRADHHVDYGLYMLSDFASAHYLWEVLQDAKAEFSGTSR